ncbi:MAG: putative sulfate exporter family transporter [Deltaproteobacteria bacterium]|nr:MAG: putative sulfate exporter family transporter [Deltaproteobacteria bacterium]
MDTHRWKQIFFLTLLAVCGLPQVSTGMALLAGIVFSLVLGNPFPQQSTRWSKVLLQLSVVGLGFGLSLGQVWQVGKSSIFYTVIGICATLLVGMALGRLFHIERNTAVLISFGTAICGGSAIAAMSPVIKARDDEAALALATVFTLNAVALFLFPAVGHLIDLSQQQFGIWAGLAIHDTSSVVGAAAAYGKEALDMGTTVKLSRAIWIVPFVLVAGWVTKTESKAKVPLFIIGFIFAAALRSLLPQFISAWSTLATIARQALVVTLFLIGAGLSREVLKNVGVRPLAQGVSLWLLVGGLSLAAILQGLIG